MNSARIIFNCLFYLASISGCIKFLFYIDIVFSEIAISLGYTRFTRSIKIALKKYTQL